MFKFLRAAVFVALKLALNAHAAIGPVTDLTIMNANVAPDGHTRPAVLAEGMLPGPLIVGQKGDRFRINVINNLANHTMLKSTSIVSTLLHDIPSSSCIVFLAVRRQPCLDLASNVLVGV